LSDRVAAQGGQIRIESGPGAGTTLIAELPCAC
jgi:signal transduction histidine kinase